MEHEENVSILDVIENSLVRKNLFNAIPGVKDINNLAKTCRQAYLTTQNERIKKDMMTYKDIQTIIIKPREEKTENQLPLKLKDVIFQKDDRTVKVLDDVEKFIGETVRSWNCLTYIICNLVENFRKFDYIPLVKKLVREMDMNCRLRNDAKILNFVMKSYNNHYMLLHALGYMKHDNVMKILLPSSIFMQDDFYHKELKSGIFDGFPELNELSIVNSIGEINYTDDKIDENLLEHVLKEFSKKKDPKLILGDSDITYVNFPKYVDMILRLATKYQLQICCNSYYLFNKINTFIYPVEEGKLSTKKLLVSATFSIPSHSQFPIVMKKLQSHTNLKKLGLKFHFFPINHVLTGLLKFDDCDISLRNCTKMKEVQFIFQDYSFMDDSNKSFAYIKEGFRKNLVSLSSLMPSTVERMDLWYLSGMTNEIASDVARNLPNIKILKTFKVGCSESSWIEEFKNLQSYISCDSDMVSVPNTVNVLIVKNNKNLDGIIEKPLKNDVFEKYSSQFLKCLKNNDDDYIFFNDLDHWLGIKTSMIQF